MAVDVERLARDCVREEGEGRGGEERGGEERGGEGGEERRVEGRGEGREGREVQCELSVATLRLHRGLDPGLASSHLPMSTNVISMADVSWRERWRLW